MKKILIISLLLCWTWSWGQSHQVDSEQLSRMYANGVLRFSMGDSKGAKSIFELVARSTNNTHAPSLSYMARIAAQQEQFVQALDNIGQALKMDSTNIEYLRQKGYLLFSKGDYALAWTVFDTLVAREPSNPENRVIAGALAMENKQYDKALNIFDTYEQRWGADERVADSKRQILITQKRYDELLKYSIWISSQMPGDPKTLIQLAEVYAAMRQDSSAVVCYKAAIAMDSTDLKPHYAYAEYCRLKGLKSDYLDALRPIISSPELEGTDVVELFRELFSDLEIVKTHSAKLGVLALDMAQAHLDDKDVMELYGQYLLWAKRLDEAALFYQTQIEKGNNAPENFEILCQLQWQRQESSLALKAANDGLVIYPKNHQLLILGALILQEQGQTKPSLEMLARAIKTAANDSLSSVILGLRGDIYHQQGDQKRAFADYAKALKHDANNASVLNNWAYFLSLTGKNLDHALTMAEKANEIEPQNPTYLDTQAWVLHLLGRSQQAKDIMLLALGLDRDPSSEVLQHYSDILKALGDTYMANEYQQRAEQKSSAEKK